MLILVLNPEFKGLIYSHKGKYVWTPKHFFINSTFSTTSTSPMEFTLPFTIIWGSDQSLCWWDCGKLYDWMTGEPELRDWDDWSTLSDPPIQDDWDVFFPG